MNVEFVKSTFKAAVISRHLSVTVADVHAFKPCAPADIPARNMDISNRVFMTLSFVPLFLDDCTIE